MMNDGGDKVIVNNCLHLLLVTSCDVREEPNSFFVDFLLAVVEEQWEVGESIAVEYNLKAKSISVRFKNHRWYT